MAGTSERSGRWNLLGGRGTFGTRLLALLLLAAPFPLALLGLISLSQFEAQLRSETDERLTARARDAGFALYGRLVDVDRGLGIEGAPEAQLDENPVSPPWQRKLRALFETASPDRLPPHPGAPVLDEAQRVRLLEGSAVLSIGRDPLDRPSIWLLRPKPGSTTGVLWAELEAEWLWPASSVPPESGVHWALLDAGRWEILATSPAPAAEFLHALDSIGVGASGGFAWDDAEGDRHRARFWTVPLGFEFAYRGLSTVVSETDPVEPSVGALRRSLVLGGSAALLFAALVVARRLRSDLAPLTKLSGAAERLEQGDLAARVRIAGPSDLARLGDSFNRMADGLERQFHLLEASQEVTLAALESEPDQVSIARLFVARMRRILPGGEISVALLGGRGRT
ncbi:MAG TPA: HAMP domain-containing protein, partial [Thermoanaerobaculia bacterium]|nr:HAMP domain-containing protein [Thermoanaerobaculia bacterium]